MGQQNWGSKGVDKQQPGEVAPHNPAPAGVARICNPTAQQPIGPVTSSPAAQGQPPSPAANRPSFGRGLQPRSARTESSSPAGSPGPLSPRLFQLAESTQLLQLLSSSAPQLPSSPALQLLSSLSSSGHS